jgi:gamma-glutamylaminecyclotransferase
MNKNIAVYGTLKKGFGNHGLVRDSEFIGSGETEKEYTMYRHGIPFVKSTEKTSKIKVEIYSVNEKDLIRVDLLEGHPDWYQRKPVTVVLDNGFTVDAELYFYDSSISPRAEKVLDGNYV